MATIEKFAAIPIDKYLRLINRVQQSQDIAKSDTLAPNLIPHQSGQGQEHLSGKNLTEDSTDKDKDSDMLMSTNSHKSKLTHAQPPPGLPLQDELAGDSDFISEDNWSVLWQQL